MRDPVRIDVAPEHVVASTVVHRVFAVAQEQKRDLLTHVLTADPSRQTLVFCRTKHGSDRVGRHLETPGLRTAVIHGDKTQGARKRALGDFKAGRVTVLVATDVAARGLDIEKLPLVVNFDLPLVAQDYIHRIGRTGRAGQSGEAISLATNAERGCCTTSRSCCRRRSNGRRAGVRGLGAAVRASAATARAAPGMTASADAMSKAAARRPVRRRDSASPAQPAPQGPGPPAARGASGWR